MPTGDALRALPFWDRMTPAEQASALSCAVIRTCPAQTLIYARDQACLGLLRVLSGRARTFMLSEEGREIVLYRMETGDVDVLSASCVVNQITFETQIVADSDCTLLVLPALYLARLKEQNLAVRCFIYETLGQRFSDVMHVMQSMLFDPIDKRLADCLLRRANGSREVVATHEQLAGEINSAREVVSRTLKDMERRGLLELGRGRIRLRDQQALRLLSE